MLVMKLTRIMGHNVENSFSPLYNIILIMDVCLLFILHICFKMEIIVYISSFFAIAGRFFALQNNPLHLMDTDNFALLASCVCVCHSRSDGCCIFL